MHPIYNYDLYIFDCDGVILDSNTLKIQAMKEALEKLLIEPELVTQCIDYFAKNFGKSRYHHVNYFADTIFNVEQVEKSNFKKALLKDFSNKCSSLYMNAELTPGFLELIKSLPGQKYVASGSEQGELRKVFNNRGLSKYFDEIYGSPTKKSELIENILNLQPNLKSVMIGDAVSDFESSRSNNIDFFCYLPYSNVKKTMKNLATKHGFSLLNSWPNYTLVRF